MFYSKFVQNSGAQDAIANFLNERYLEGSEGLFGRGDPATIEEFKNQLSKKMTDISAFEVSRIAETSVQRVRNWSHLSQAHQAGIDELEIYEPTAERNQCQICIAMHGKTISVPTANQHMQEMTAKTPEEAMAWFKDPDNSATVENAVALLAKGVAPPFHPFCRGKLIKKVRKG
jgi:hypothetical protein